MKVEISIISLILFAISLFFLGMAFVNLIASRKLRKLIKEIENKSNL